MLRSLQHLCVTVYWLPALRQFAYCGIIDNETYPGTRLDGTLYAHNEEGPFSFPIEPLGYEFTGPYYCLYGEFISKEEWEIKVTEIKKNEHDIMFNNKFNELIK